MTESKALKARIRERQERTGESYVVARMHVLREGPQIAKESPAPSRQVRERPLESPETKRVLELMYRERWMDDLFDVRDRLADENDMNAIFERKAQEHGIPPHVVAELKTHSWYLVDDWGDQFTYGEDYSSEGWND